jgi:hypothetical protein
MECQFFIESIRSLPPRQQCIEIERFVRQIFYYDYKNSDTVEDKKNQTLNDQMILCQQRASDLSTNPDLKDKLE